MGVFHISGVGTSPGAVTVPLSCVYCLLKLAYEGNDNKAREFFRSSGEFSGNESYAGKPEALILFSSQDAFNSNRINQSCNWFTINSTNNIEVIKEYLSNLTKDKLRLNYQPLPLKYLCGVCVNMSDFEDIFLKAYLTMNALRDKEIWINLVGGANQINLALILAAGLACASVRFYYVFEWDNQNNRPSNSLHPTWFDLNNFDLNNFDSQIILSKWMDVPLLMLGWSEIIRWLTNIFPNEETVVNIGQIRSGLENLGYNPQQLMPKLRYTVLIIENDRVKISPMFMRLINLIQNLQQIGQINNFSNWLEWCNNNGIIFLRQD